MKTYTKTVCLASDEHVNQDTICQGKDRHAAVSRQMAYEVNEVFNLANEITSEAYSNAGDFGAQ
ncbi:hypothetical protein ACAD17_003972 [Enterobacter ludwigii]